MFMKRMVIIKILIPNVRDLRLLVLRQSLIQGEENDIFSGFFSTVHHDAIVVIVIVIVVVIVGIVDVILTI